MSEKCLGGVWGLVSDFEYCLGGYDVQAIHKHPIRLILISRSSLVMAKKCPIGGCRGVSGGCQGVVWMTLGGMMCQHW